MLKQLLLDIKYELSSAASDIAPKPQYSLVSAQYARIGSNHK